MKATILLVEDGITYNYIFRDVLTKAGYNVKYCYDAEIAYKIFTDSNDIDICLFDAVLPNMDGLTLTRKIREIDKNIPILIQSLNNTQEWSLMVLESGADGKLVKPFTMSELLLIVEVFLKRSGKICDDKPYVAKLGNLKFNYNALTLTGNGIKRNLTQREADLLRYLCTNANKILTREEILLNVWGKNDYFLGRAIDVFITKIRIYIKGQENVILETIPKIGFKFIVPD